MSTNLKRLVPMALVFGIAMGGTAFAGANNQTDANDLYGQPNPFAAVQAPAEDSGWSTANDQRIHKELQQTSTAPSSGFGWRNLIPTAQEDLGHGRFHDPE